MKTTPLTEQVADWQEHLQVDHHHRLVRNVALTGLISKNGYRYAPDALRQAVSLYEHKPVFLDHAPDGSRPQVRSTRDLVGTIVSPRFEQGRIRGDIRTLDTESGRLFLTLTASNAPGLGMSHVVLAERTTDEGDVTRIHDVISVDAVVFPATTTTFREAQRDPPQTPDVTATDGASPAPTSHGCAKHSIGGRKSATTFDNDWRPSRRRRPSPSTCRRSSGCCSRPACLPSARRRRSVDICRRRTTPPGANCCTNTARCSNVCGSSSPSAWPAPTSAIVAAMPGSSRSSNARAEPPLPPRTFPTPLLFERPPCLITCAFVPALSTC